MTSAVLFCINLFSQCLGHHATGKTRNGPCVILQNKEAILCSQNLEIWNISLETPPMPQSRNYNQISVQRVPLYFCHIIYKRFFNLCFASPKGGFFCDTLKQRYSIMITVNQKWHQLRLFQLRSPSPIAHAPKKAYHHHYNIKLELNQIQMSCR